MEEDHRFKAITNATSSLMEREVSRVEFIQYVGIALVGMLGITAFLRNLHHNVPSHGSPIPASKSPAMPSGSSRGYGGSAYGR